MARTITQRQLRNESGAIMDALDHGESFIVTRRGLPVRRADAGEAPTLRQRRPRPRGLRWRTRDQRRPLAPTSTSRSTRTSRREPGQRSRGLLDTSAVIDLPHTAPDKLPAELAISALTLAELAAGPHATTVRAERARRQDRLQRTEATFDPLPFDDAASRAYGRIYASVTTAGHKARGQRAVDLLIAAIALAHGLPSYTCDPEDFVQLADLEVAAVASGAR